MKSKQFMAGIIVGSVLTSGVGVFAAGQIVSATKTDDTKIFVDGEELELEDGFAILNYDGRVYTSTRAIAEALDATVEYEVTDSSKNINIIKPEEVISIPVPDVDTEEKEDITEETDTEETEEITEETDTEEIEETEDDDTSSIDYRTPPLKGSGLGVSVLLKEANTPYQNLELDVEITNNNSEGNVIFDYSKIRIETEDDDVYYVMKETSSDNTMFYSSIPLSASSETETLQFRTIPAGTKCIFIMPLTRYDISGKTEDYEIEIPFIVEEYDYSSTN